MSRLLVFMTKATLHLLYYTFMYSAFPIWDIFCGACTENEITKLMRTNPAFLQIEATGDFCTVGDGKWNDLIGLNLGLQK